MKLLSNKNVALCACLKILNIISLSVINIKASGAAQEAVHLHTERQHSCVTHFCQLVKQRTLKEIERGLLLSLLKVQSNLF